MLLAEQNFLEHSTSRTLVSHHLPNVSSEAATVASRCSAVLMPPPPTKPTHDAGPGYGFFRSTANGQLYVNKRMGSWLEGLPAPLSPQERYIQGMMSGADHPLHPHPLRTPEMKDAEMADVPAHKVEVPPSDDGGQGGAPHSELETACAPNGENAVDSKKRQRSEVCDSPGQQ